MIKYILKKTISDKDKQNDNKKIPNKDKIHLEFTCYNESYAIDFELGDKTFIYQLTLVKEDKFYATKKHIL